MCSIKICMFIISGFGQWPMSGNQTTDGVNMNAQEAVEAHKDTQGKIQF